MDERLVNFFVIEWWGKLDRDIYYLGLGSSTHFVLPSFDFPCEYFCFENMILNFNNYPTSSYLGYIAC